jgi:hypothetical protein
VIAPHRPYLIAASVALLAFGFWRAYRPSGGGAACSVRTGKAVRATLWIAAALTLTSLLAPRFWS